MSNATDAIVAQAIADAYEKGRASGYESGYNAGFLVSASAGTAEEESRLYEDADGNTRCRRCLAKVEGGYCVC